MNKKILDILACPIDKYSPLEIFELKSNVDIIIEGILYCIRCRRFYPIIDEIPILLPDELRNEDGDKKFLKNNKKKLPDKIIRYSLPWNMLSELY